MSFRDWRVNYIIRIMKNTKTYFRGGFSVVRFPNGKAEFVDFRESAPFLSNETMYMSDPRKSIIGGLAVGVPGEIRGYELLHSKYGKLSWKELFLPSIALSNSGFKVGHILNLRLKSNEKWILMNERFKEVYAPNGTILGLGDIVRIPKLSAALTKISKEGAKAFYEGDIAKDIVDTIQNNSGILSMKDLKNYKAILREPVISTVFNSTIITSSAPTSGAILVSTLKLLESVIKTSGKGSPSDIYHKYIEALKFGFASRTRLGDPNFSKSILEYSKEIISDEYINNLSPKVDLKHTHEPPYYNPMFAPKELPGTTHISVIDNYGIAISLTSTINLEFGSRVMTPNFGIILNNEMNDFSTPELSQEYNLSPNHYNYIEPNKRPLSSTVPTIIVKPNGELTALGGSGGSKILSAVIQVIVELEINSKDLKTSLDSARIHHQLIPDVVFFEENLEKTIIEDLTANRHNVSGWRNSHRSIVQIVRKKSDGQIEGKLFIN
jgi:gamma-glutamyltranspeptidase